MFSGIYSGKKVLVTGHTGFKGAWLSQWLIQLGADVSGFSLPPSPRQPSMFAQLDLKPKLRHHEGDVRDLNVVRTVIQNEKPDFVFHLAAQPLVLLSYLQPVETFATNVMGSVHVLQAVREMSSPCTLICISTDKCYENREWLHSYREEDPLGGHDPYSASKGSAEIAIHSYRRSFYSAEQSLIKIASARAGNVIGGGDWALDRIVPDCIRALQSGQIISVRNKISTRPWQHVLEPLSGYLWLAAQLSRSSAASPLASAFNFGPSLTSNRSVAELVEELIKHWPGTWEDESNPNAAHEATLLNLAVDKAQHLLGWRPVWGFEETIKQTVDWYRYRGCVKQFTTDQIHAYLAAAAALKLPWAA
jgi:CDP-glucose 4,6-dehydratase